MDEWLVVDLAPVGSLGFTRDGEILRVLFEKFPVDSGWTLLSPPLEALELRHLDFSEILEEANNDINLIKFGKIRELAITRGFPALHRRALWLRLIPETWKFVPGNSSVPAEISSQIDKDVHRTIPEKSIAEFQRKLAKILTRFASHK